MPNKLQKSFQDYQSKIKKQTPHLHFLHGSFSSATSKIILSCKHPRSFSFDGECKDSRKDSDRDQDQDHKKNEDNAATLEDIDRFLFENFKSLYAENHDDDDNEDEEKAQNSQNHHSNIFAQGGTLFDSPRLFTPPPDLCGSHRFFRSPASSSSSCSSAQGHNSPAIPKGVEDCIAILKVSPCPYEEFRRSMTEVIEGRIYDNQRVDWDFMEELLFCYLRLNEKKQYRYILSAFVDLVGNLRQNSTSRERKALDNDNQHAIHQNSSNRETEAIDHENKHAINKGKGRRHL